MNDLIGIDLETGGTIPGTHAVLSIAAVTAAGASFHRLIKPGKGLLIEPEAVKVNGYTPEAWAIGGAVDVLEAARDFRDFVTTAKRGNGAWIPLAHNAGFDKSFTEWIERHVGFEFGLSYHWECSMAVLSFLMRRGAVPHGKCNLDRLCELAGVSRKTPHCALSDAEACLSAYRWLLTKAGEAEDTLRQLYTEGLKERNILADALKAKEAASHG